MLLENKMNFCKRCGKPATQIIRWIDKGKEKCERLCDDHALEVMEKRRENVRKLRKNHEDS
jgi:uncharacterized protein (DUF1015 family)